MASVEALVAPVGSVAEAPDAGVDAAPEDAGVAPDAGGDEGGERWGAEHRESGPCVPHSEKPDEETVSEPNGPRKLFSFHGYRAWTMRVQRTIDRKLRTHCVQVAFPAGKRNSDDKPVTVSAHIDDGWLRAIENTLQRLPWRHLQVVRRVVIDDRPKEHGIAPFDRRSADDGRDGRTLWLHERLFREPNHWAHGNHGRYWSYHTDIDGETLDNRSPDHARFSPVMLHEIGHLVAYNVVNRNPANEAVPSCARICGDQPGGCKGMLAPVRERGCISAYCMPFQFETGTENWAEMYRFHYQSAATRSLLTTAEAGCVKQLDTINDGRAAPWAVGLPDIADFRRTLWKSCDERPCKGWLNTTRQAGASSGEVHAGRCPRDVLRPWVMVRPSCLAWPGLSLLLACSPAGGGAPVAGPSQAIICPEGKVLGRNNTCEAAAPLPPPSSSVAAAPLPPVAVFQPMPRPSGSDPTALRGRWFGEDSDGSAAYDLAVSADGTFSQTITTLHTNSGRSAGSCLQQGLLRVEGDQVIWSYERNTCNTDYEGKEDPDGLVEQDARHFVLQMEGYQVHYSRR